MNAEFDISGIRIETKRLILREWTEDDLQDFYEYASEEGTGESAGWKHHESIEESSEILSLFIKEKKTFAVVLKEENKAVGSLGIEPCSNEESHTGLKNLKGRELGFVLSRRYRRRGLMTEAVNAVTYYLFSVLNYDFLLCSYYDKNTASKALQEKCGFKEYGRFVFTTRMGSRESGVTNILFNPSKRISAPES